MQRAITGCATLARANRARATVSAAMLGALLLLASLAAPLAWTAEPAGMTPWLQSQVGSARIPGFVAMVVDARGTRYVGAFGLQDVAGNVPMRARCRHPRH